MTTLDQHSRVLLAVTVVGRSCILLPQVARGLLTSVSTLHAIATVYTYGDQKEVRLFWMKRLSSLCEVAGRSSVEEIVMAI